MGGPPGDRGVPPEARRGNHAMVSAGVGDLVLGVMTGLKVYRLVSH